MKKKKLVILSGAGISAESGIATFRDSDGLWENYKIEEVATPQAWLSNPDLVTRFYNMRRQSVKSVKPNLAHLGLVDLEKKYDVSIITQNIDDLHERAGSKHVIHLHGEIFKLRCEEDDNDCIPYFDDVDAALKSKKGKMYRPDIVWFGEPVKMMETAVSIAETADIFVIIGTSLNVYPAAGLYQYAPSGIPIYIIDKSLPNYHKLPNITVIEKIATEGVKDLINILKA